MTAAQCILVSRCGEEDLLKFKPSIRMGKKGYLSDFKPSLGFTENGPKKRKYPVSGSCVDENTLLMSEKNGQAG